MRMDSGMSAPANRRQHARHDTDWLAEVTAHTHRVAGSLRNVSSGGALVTAGPEVALRPSDCIRLRFALPGTMRVSVCGRVRWVSPPTEPGGPVEFGVSFYGLSRVERQVIVEYASHTAAEFEESSEVAVHKKYLVRRDEARLWIWISGSLNEVESRDLHALVGSQSAHRFNRSLIAFLDVRELGTCPRDSLKDFRAWLSLLGRANPFGGVLLAEDSTASVQVRRLIREAGIADSLVAFSEENEAKEFWTILEQGILQTPPGGALACA